MKLLIREVKVADPTSPHDGKVRTIFIEEGIIKTLNEKNIDAGKDVTVLDGKGRFISPGWFDMRVNFRDPGYEYKEDILSGIQAATAGGFTGVLCMPSTLPSIHTKSVVEYVRNKAAGHLVDVYPAGAVSQKLEGKEMTEMYDMHLSGALAFTDDKHPIMDTGLMVRALLYTKNFGGLVISFANDHFLCANGKANEGVNATKLGLKGIPSLAEEVMIARDIYLAEYTDSRIHFAMISSAKSVELIRQAKAKGIKVTAEAGVANLTLNDSRLTDFDSNFKVMPPLRTQQDVEALHQGLADGTIDVICSDHSPEDSENKIREFDHAAFGMIGLESAFGASNTALNNVLSTSQLVEKMAVRPRQILNLPVPTVKEGSAANLTLFQTDQQWTFTSGHIKSKSKNTPFTGTTFSGKAIAVINNGKFALCE